MLSARTIAVETKLIAHAYSRDRESFRLPEETYEGWAIIASEKGTFEYAVGDETGEAKAGEAVLCPPGIPFHRRTLGLLDFHYVQFHLSTISPDGPIEFPYLGKIVFRDTSRLLSTLAALRDAREHVSQQYLEHLVTDLLYQYIGERAASRRERKPRDSAIQEAVRYVNEHAYEDISMQLVASRVGLSQSQFTRKFQKELGISPVKYWTGVRLRKVRQLLAETDEPLEAIAELCGYQNAFYLSRVFSREMDISPSEYRRSHRV
ncbi:helix-turn-helix domain-containing protein [Paenibacillus ginsengarvi]|uniref:helix-turn-helix domain-containing protein n=1 Tax=Paenibacillus ginsengarvi TaxID=400777 RepID=UPI0013154455|nr:AraC family transcriptional regulator [Paenibacillus ginsengarvi]